MVHNILAISRPCTLRDSLSCSLNVALRLSSASFCSRSNYKPLIFSRLGDAEFFSDIMRPISIPVKSIISANTESDTIRHTRQRFFLGACCYCSSFSDDSTTCSSKANYSIWTEAVLTCARDRLSGSASCSEMTLLLRGSSSEFLDSYTISIDY
jgi:hypothetical protein